MDYKEILSSELRMTYIALSVIILAALALFGLFFWWYKTFTDKRKKNKKQLKKRKRSLIEWSIGVGISSILIAWGIIAQAISINQINYDINNDAYITYTGECYIDRHEYWFITRKHNVEYYVCFSNGEREIELLVSDEIFETLKLYEGESTSLCVVYSEKSELLLDIYRIEE